MHKRAARFVVATTMVMASSLLVAPPASAEGLPKTANKRIVVGKSVGGVKIGMSMKKAAKKWSEGESAGGCFPSGYKGRTECTYELIPSGANYNTGNIKYVGKKKVLYIGIHSPHDGIQPSKNALLAKFKTKDGIGVGTGVKKLKRSFGKKLKLSESSYKTKTYVVAGPKKRKTTFVVHHPTSGKPFVSVIRIDKS